MDFRKMNKSRTVIGAKKSNSTLPKKLKECLLLEYHNVEKYCPLDLFISLNQTEKLGDESLLIWDGTLIIKEGVYNGLYIEFIICFPKNYPLFQPSVTFNEKIFHPLINQDNNSLDVKYIFGKWIPGKNSVVQLLYKIKDIFLNPKYFFVTESYNKECGKLFIDNYIEFENKVQESITKSKNNIKDKKMNEKNEDKNLIKEFKAILRKNNISEIEKMEQLEKYFLFKYDPYKEKLNS